MIAAQSRYSSGGMLFGVRRMRSHLKIIVGADIRFRAGPQFVKRKRYTAPKYSGIMFLSQPQSLMTKYAR